MSTARVGTGDFARLGCVLTAAFGRPSRAQLGNYRRTRKLWICCRRGVIP